MLIKLSYGPAYTQVDSLGLFKVIVPSDSRVLSVGNLFISFLFPLVSFALLFQIDKELTINDHFCLFFESGVFDVFKVLLWSIEIDVENGGLLLVFVIRWWESRIARTWLKDRPEQHVQYSYQYYDVDYVEPTPLLLTLSLSLIVASECIVETE